MSEQKNISPLLDDFTLGAPISEHHGVVCSPAIKENTNKKYIVKKISVPATQAQFDALLLAGAYKDPGDAMEYFRRNGEDILEEAEILKKLSRLEGFLPYDGWQMEPITRRRLGYEVYLVGSYKRSLEKFMRKNPFTHLEAVNLGLDLCAALAVCRQSGYLYADLKPSNIFVSEKKEFRIGDLGFLSLDSMRYASLPERYFSPYTPPELLDPMAEMNLTVDTYAVGMILYQIYNDGNLPFTGVAPLETLPVPCHADYEMAEIIMKAIHPEPDQRWTDPRDLGKAIASYMQRNSINDIPITPFIPLDVKPEDIIPVSDTTDTDNSSNTAAAEPETETVVPADRDPVLTEEEGKAEEESCDDASSSDEDTAVSEADDTASEEAAASDEAVASDENEDPEEPEELPQPADSDEDTPETAVSDEPQEEEETDELEGVSEEVVKIITKADDIISHEIPGETLFPTEEPPPDPFSFAAEETDDLYLDFPEDPYMDEEPEISKKDKKKKKTKHFADTTRKEKFRKFLSRLFTLMILCVLAVCGFWYYRNIYLQTIDSITIHGTQNQITVLVDTGIEESALRVLCIDENGKSRSASVEGGKATVSGLQPNTQYTIQMDMSGFHKLVGQTSDVFTTDATTRVLSIQAIAGPEDGSVVLDFIVEGEDPNFWNIRYSAEGEEEGLETVTGHSATISGLTVGKLYTFTLDGGKDFGLGGNTSVQYMASRLILAEDITVTSENGTEITVNWNNPGDVVVDNWKIRLYDGYGFEEETTVTENKVQFSNIDPASKYTVEIIAAGMTKPSTTVISADPIILSGFRIDEGADTEIKISWDHSGQSPEGGWELLYTVDGSGSQVITSEKASVAIAPKIPGATYSIVLQAADGRTVYNNTVQYQTQEAEAFTEHKFSAENIDFGLLKTPEESGWSAETIGEDSMTDTFHAGEPASMVMRSSTDIYIPGYKVSGLFVFRNTYGNVLTELVTEVSFNWRDIWAAGDTKTAEMEIPRLPTAPGNYVMELYFNGGFVTEFDIVIAE